MNQRAKAVLILSLWSAIAMKAAIVLALALAPSADAMSAETDDLDPSFYGTLSVEFMPTQIEGELKGCELVYNALVKDYRYLKGAPVVVNGSIHYLWSSKPAILLFTLKIGLSTVKGGKPVLPFEPPVSAYLQTKNASTAKVKGKSIQGEGGHKLFTANAIDPAILTLTEDLITDGKIALAYARKSGGMDVLVPLDMTVTGIRLSGAEVARDRSTKAPVEFASCISEMMGGVMAELSAEVEQ